MKTKYTVFFLLCLLISLLTACQQDPAAYMQDPISLSGDTGYYAAMDADLRKAALSMRHIEVSGIISAEGYTTIFVGDEKQDGICFSCTFSERSDNIAALKEGATVCLHGICTGIVGNLVYLEHCLLTSTAPSATVPAATIPPTTIPPTTVPSTTVPPTTIPPATTPSTTLPQVTEPVTVPDAGEDAQDMVWVPQSGKKYHMEPNCSGMKNPTQIEKEEAEDRGFTPCKKCYP